MIANQVITDSYAIYNGDSAEMLQSLPDDSAHLSIYSPPFATVTGQSLYQYTSSHRDLSNARGIDAFMEHYRFFVEQIHRLLLPGRICAVHCMDVPKQGANICGYDDFPGRIIRLHEDVGFEMLPRICIWKEPLEVRNRTMSKSLAHRQIVEDACQTNVASADYLIPFRKRGENPVPVTHPNGFTRYIGMTPIPADLLRYRGWTGKQIENRYSHEVWQRYASCVWGDIDLHRTLPFTEGKDEQDERHMHPLQLDVIERAVEMWTNEGETVLTPFMGVGSEVYGAVINGRRGIGCELKESYYRQAVKNLENAKRADEQLNHLALLDS